MSNLDGRIQLTSEILESRIFARVAHDADVAFCILPNDDGTFECKLTKKFIVNALGIDATPYAGNPYHIRIATQDGENCPWQHAERIVQASGYNHYIYNFTKRTLSVLVADKRTMLTDAELARVKAKFEEWLAWYFEF